jgi:hypothetical protein
VIKIAVGGEVDVHMIERMVRTDEMLIGYPAGIQHPPGTYLRHKRSEKTGRRMKRMERATSMGEAVENATLAEWLHNGTADVAARPFLLQGIRSELEAIRGAIKSYHQERMKGKEGNLAKIGALAVGAVQRFVRSGYYKGKIPNAPSTIKRKGSDTPLIDSSFLVNSTAFVVRNLMKRPDRRAKLRVVS